MTLLFLAQYRRTRAVPLLLLGAGSLYTTLIVLTQLVCFPNIFAPGLLLGTGAPTLTWLWNFWHLGPTLFALPYAIMSIDDRPQLTSPARLRPALWSTVAAITVAAGLTALLTISYVQYLPATADADGGYRALTTSGIGPILTLLNALSLAVLCWTTRLRSVLQLWMGVALLLLLVDNIVTDLGAARGTVGWYVGRLDALLAGIVVLGVYLREIDFLYRRAEQTALAREVSRAETQAARESLEIALEASGMGDWELDLHSGACHRTLRHDRIFGYSELQPDWNWAKMLAHLHPLDRPAAEAAMATAHREGRLELECRFTRTGEDKIRWIAVHGRTYYDRLGAPVAMAGCMIDVTDRRIAEERLRQTERLEAVGQLTGGVAHDFNNLLTVILGMLESISSDPDDPVRVSAIAKDAFTAAIRGTELTEKLLSFSRRQVVQPETVNVNRLIGDFKALVQRTVGEAIAGGTGSRSVARIRYGSTRTSFRRQFLNLAGNARDAMPSGGRLRLETRNVTLTAGDSNDLDEGRRR